jgi:hypothetical protein
MSAAPAEHLSQHCISELPDTQIRSKLFSGSRVGAREILHDAREILHDAREILHDAREILHDAREIKTRFIQKSSSSSSPQSNAPPV